MNTPPMSSQPLTRIKSPPRWLATLVVLAALGSARAQTVAEPSSVADAENADAIKLAPFQVVDSGDD
ncbi:MAG TPA: hypothetical protein VHE61_15550, partial [Opitutaceae bacterium]|nr:hypothetical protein [Opitutaceae bacterium]